MGDYRSYPKSSASPASSDELRYTASDKDALLPVANTQSLGIQSSSYLSQLTAHLPAHWHHVKRRSGRWIPLTILMGLLLTAVVRSGRLYESVYNVRASNSYGQGVQNARDGLAGDQDGNERVAAIPGGGAARWRYSHQDVKKPEESETSALHPPLTSLGPEADLVYENVGSTDPVDYRNDLEQFLLSAFPSLDSNASDPDSLVSILHDYFPPPRPLPHGDNPQQAFQRMALLPLKSFVQGIQSLRLGALGGASKASLAITESRKPHRHHTIQKSIFQTSWQAGDDAPSDSLSASSWKDLNRNDGYVYNYFDDRRAGLWMAQRFGTNASELATSTVHAINGGSIADTYVSMAGIPVMQSDFWRYAVLASEGGIYSDLDTTCLRPIMTWHRDPWARWTPKQADVETQDSLSASSRGVPAEIAVEPTPAVIIGVEQDVGDRSDWHQWWPRPLGIVQWTIASTRGHPIMLDVLRRVSHSVNPVYAKKGVAGSRDQGLKPLNIADAATSVRNLEAVVEQTGPGPFTDSVLRYLGAKYNVSWPDLRDMPPQGRMYGDNDVLVLSVTAFSPGVGNFGAGDTTHDAALVLHGFSGSWKSAHGR